MAAIIAGAVGEVAGLLGGSGIGATIAKGALGGAAAIGASQLLTAIEHDLSAGGTSAATARRLTPAYAIVDMHSNKIVRPLSRRKVYVLLTSSRRRSRAKRERVIAVPQGTEIVTVR